LPTNSGRLSPREISCRQTPADFPPGKFPAGKLRQTFPPGNFLPENSGRLFPREISCRQIPADFFPGKFLADKFRQTFPPGNFLPTNSGRLSPREISCRKTPAVPGHIPDCRIVIRGVRPKQSGLPGKSPSRGRHFLLVKYYFRIAKIFRFFSLFRIIMKGQEEQIILQAIAAGNVKAFEQLFFEYHPRLIYFLVGLTHDMEVSRDMAQDLFLSLWNNRKNLDKLKSFSSYLFQMARYTVYDYFDRRVVSEKYSQEFLMEASRSGSDEEGLFVRELQSIIDRTVEQMSPQRARIYRMSREEGLSNDEIAIRLGISKRTVENHLTSALSILRRVLYLIFLFSFLH
jgi:RNA polymerase sigma-70 factor (ECF subfamily)